VTDKEYTQVFLGETFWKMFTAKIHKQDGKIIFGTLYKENKMADTLTSNWVMANE
jgi:hypothetical protein